VAVAARVITGRRAVLLAAAACAVVAVFGGLARLGWQVPAGAAQIVGHGPVFVLGVFLTVISLERAVALGARAAYVGPVAAAAGGLALACGLADVGPWLVLVAAIALVAMNIVIVRRQAAAFTWAMLVGSSVLVLSLLAWIRGAPVFSIVPAWMAFFVLTIVAERLELSRLVRVSWLASSLLVVACGVLTVAAMMVMTNATAWVYVLGGAFVVVGAWQLGFDAARRTIRRRGLPRYAGLAVLGGACWLVITGALLLVRGLPAAGPDYDAPLHALFIGFVVSAVLAHAPIIGLAVARIAIPFHPVLYLPLVALHASVVLRIAGDWFAFVELRRAGALGNVIALGLLPLAIVVARHRARSS
jgi:hypothetical protein